MRAGSPDRDAVLRELAERGVAPVMVQGGCREPALREGQWVLVHRERPPRRGDVPLKGDASPH